MALLTLLAYRNAAKYFTELQEQTNKKELDPDIIFEAVRNLHKRIGSYASIALILVWFISLSRPLRIRPLVIGKRISISSKEEWMVASESLVLENNDYQVVRDVEPGEAVFISRDGEFFKQCSIIHVYSLALLNMSI